MPAGGNHGKRKACFPPFPRALEISQRRRDSHIPTAPTVYSWLAKEAEYGRLVCRGKMEIQNQDFHFPTAPMACGARMEAESRELRTLTTRPGDLPKPKRITAETKN